MATEILDQATTRCQDCGYATGFLVTLLDTESGGQWVELVPRAAAHICLEQKALRSEHAAPTGAVSRTSQRTPF